MSMRLDVLIAILGMTAVTYLCRAGGYAAFRAFRPPRVLQVALQHLPGPIFMAYVVPSLAAQGVRGFAAGALVILVQWQTGNLVAAIAAGVAAIWGLGLLG